MHADGFTHPHSAEVLSGMLSIRKSLSREPEGIVKECAALAAVISRAETSPSRSPSWSLGAQSRSVVCWKADGANSYGILLRHLSGS